MKRKQALSARAMFAADSPRFGWQNRQLCFTKRLAICGQNAYRRRQNQLRRPTEFRRSCLPRFRQGRFVVSALNDMK
jgi:hypothetical protein